MSDHTVKEIERLQAKLRNIYLRGRLTVSEQVEVDGLWARIERLETSYATQVSREVHRRATVSAKLMKEKKYVGN